MRIELNPGVRGGSWALLRPLTGRDELAVDPGMPAAANTLVERLLVAAPGTSVGPGSLGELAVADRDRLLAAIYRACFGDRIDSFAACTACGERFALVFTLDELLAHQETRAADGVSGPDAEGFYRLADGTRFRLPTVGDVEAVAAADGERAVAALLARCVAGEGDAGRVESALEELAPLLDLDIETRCPACAAPQSVRFSLAAFLLAALAGERKFLTREVHRLAVAYGWGLDEILRLSREDRRVLVGHVEAERARGGW